MPEKSIQEQPNTEVIKEVGGTSPLEVLVTPSETSETTNVIEPVVEAVSSTESETLVKEKDSVTREKSPRSFLVNVPCGASWIRVLKLEKEQGVEPPVL